MSLTLTCSLPWCHRPLHQRPAVAAGKPSGKLHRRQPAGYGHLGPAGFVPAASAQVLPVQHRLTRPAQRAHAPSGNRHAQARAHGTSLSACAFISPLGVCVARCWCPCTARLNATSQPGQIIQRWSLRPGDSCWSKTKTASFEVHQHTPQRARTLWYCGRNCNCNWRKSLHFILLCQACITRLTLYFTWHYKVL